VRPKEEPNPSSVSLAWSIPPSTPAAGDNRISIPVEDLSHQEVNK